VTYIVDEARSEKAEIDIAVGGPASIGRVFVTGHCVCGDCVQLVRHSSDMAMTSVLEHSQKAD